MPNDNLQTKINSRFENFKVQEVVLRHESNILLRICIKNPPTVWKGISTKHRRLDFPLIKNRKIF